MAAPAELREIAEKLVLAGVGAVALTAERADTLAEELSARGGIGRDEARTVVEEVVGRWRSETVRLGERTGAGLTGLFRELGLVTRDEFEELELRVAQIEHRLRLLENGGSCSGDWGAPTSAGSSGGASSRGSPCCSLLPPATASSASRSRAAPSSRPTTSPESTTR